MLDIVAVGNYYAPVDDNSEPDTLKHEVKRTCNQHFRRIDRFTQLCLIGSSRCVQDMELETNTGLYIGSRFASVSNTINVQTQMIKHGQIPKPAHFINTLSNSAGYYVGKNLGLEGKNLFLSRADASTEAVLQMAQLDLNSRNTQQILVGIADEMPYPLTDHRQRLNVEASTSLAEASHWLLLRRSISEHGESDGERSLATIEEVITLGDAREAIDWLSATPEDTIRNRFMHYSSILSAEALTREQAQAQNQLDSLIAAWPSYLPSMRLEMCYSPALTAGVIAHFAENERLKETGAPTTLITLHRDEDHRFHAIRIKKSG
ncbi:beta-ketoacyl synthase N-terminal-like domain-containing protein [Pseudomaricurvus sp.]|uniref:beta-ketoacyl synthase N-terminal-like domain-containing protein n=1 Tax=Pseudomaricurvus sp. TaxID=2004510 RepID=UPI003F6DA1D1